MAPTCTRGGNEILTTMTMGNCRGVTAGIKAKWIEPVGQTGPSPRMASWTLWRRKAIGRRSKTDDCTVKGSQSKNIPPPQPICSKDELQQMQEQGWRDPVAPFVVEMMAEEAHRAANVEDSARQSTRRYDI